MAKKRKCSLPIVDDICKYKLHMERDPFIRRMIPVKNTYIEKDTGEVVKIDYRDGAFRLL